MTEETLEKLQRTLEKDYPGVQVAGMYSPPFRVLSDEEDQEITRVTVIFSKEYLPVSSTPQEAAKQIL